MNKEEIISRLRKIISPYIQNKEAEGSINENTDFVKDLRINSANIIDIILDIESEFDIEIDNSSIERMLTVGAAMDIITSKIAAK